MIEIKCDQDLHPLKDPGLRTWLQHRLRDVDLVNDHVRVVVLEPDDPIIPTCWHATWDCWDDGPTPQPNWDLWLDLTEYILEYPDWFEALILPNDDAALLLILPKSLITTASERRRWQQASTPGTLPHPTGPERDRNPHTPHLTHDAT